MGARRFALIVGIVYLLVGLMGFIPGVRSAMPAGDTHNVVVDAQYGLLLGLFPVNILHNLVHLAVGLIGIATSRSYGGARGFSKGLAIFYGLLTIMGFIPGLDTTFGLIPIFGNDIWLHGVTALIAAYFGFIYKRQTSDLEPGRTRV